MTQEQEDMESLDGEWTDTHIIEMIKNHIGNGLDKSTAIKHVAMNSGLLVTSVYHIWVALEAK